MDIYVNELSTYTKQKHSSKQWPLYVNLSGKLHYIHLNRGAEILAHLPPLSCTELKPARCLLRLIVTKMYLSKISYINDSISQSSVYY